MKNAIAAFALVLALFVSPAFAAEPPAVSAKPSKESLLEAWEKAQKDNPNTVKIEKSGENGVYDYETTIFPYKGKLKVLNLYIASKEDFYYEDGDGADYAGTVEVQLEGLDKDFKENQPRSYYAWSRDNSLSYSDKTKKWYSWREWRAYQKAVETVSQQPACAPQNAQKQEDKPTFVSVLISWFPMILLIGVWIFAMRRMGMSKHRQLIERSFVHYDKVEKLLEEILQNTKNKA